MMRMKVDVEPDIAQQVIEWWEAKKRIQAQIADLDAKRRRMDSFKTISHRLGISPRVAERLLKNARERVRIQRELRLRGKA